MRESQHTEWKRAWRDDYLKWVCAFANADGGVLVLGRDDDGAPLGLPDAPRLLEELPNKVRDLLGLVVDVNLLTEDGHELIEVHVAPAPYPVSYKGAYHYRSGSTKQELKGAALDQFLLRKQGRHWDGVPAAGFGLDDLSPDAIARFREAAARSGRVSEELLSVPDTTLIDKLRLTDGAYLKRAAVLLFGRDPERLITGAYVKIGFFQTHSDLLYHDEIHGDLFTQVESTLDLLLTKYLRAGLSYAGLQRIERFPIPESALREAVINAVAHKDYATAIPIQISVYHDRLMLWNPGQLPQGWTLESLTEKHASHPHNPDIANAFFRTSYLESWGRGIELIHRACEQYGSPPPEMRWDNGLWVVFPFSSTAERKPREGLDERLDERLDETLGPTRARIVQLMRSQPTITITKLATALGLSRTAIDKNVQILKSQGYIRRIGPARGGRWEVIL